MRFFRVPENRLLPMDTAFACEARLHIVTTAVDTALVPHDGSYTCGCEPCVADRVDLVERGVRPLPRQPYHPVFRDLGVAAA